MSSSPGSSAPDHKSVPDRTESESLSRASKMSSSPESSAPDHKSVPDQSASMDSESESLSLGSKMPSSPKSSLPDPKRCKRVGQFDLGNKKVCIVIRRSIPEFEWNSSIEYVIFVIDLNVEAAAAAAPDYNVDDDDMVRTLNPTILIDCGIHDTCIMDAFCVLGKTLYMFEGNIDRGGYESRKSVFSFDLSDVSDVESKTITRTYVKSSLKKICDMLSPKPNPLAIPTPDGSKIVIFPTVTFKEECELFCPTDKERTCQQLPKLPIPPDECIRLYGFISNSKLMIHASTGFYLLDLNSPNKGWDHPNSVLGGIQRLFPTCGTSPVVTVEERFCLATTGGVFDLKEFVGEFDDDDLAYSGFVDLAPYPVIHELYRNYFGCLDTYFAFLGHDKENERFNFCQLLIHPAFLLISVCYINLKKYKTQRPFIALDEGMSVKEESTVVVKRFKIDLNVGRGFNLHLPSLISGVCV